MKPFFYITMRKVSGCCIFLLLNWVSASAQKIPSSQQIFVKDAAFRSSSLQREMHYRIILPAAYKNGGRFPVLYLLHGVFGDYKNWDARTHLENYAKNMRMIIAMPDADDSWYTNSATVPADRFEDYIVKDFIPEIDVKFRTIHDRHARAIAGLSMGGYGAVKLALKYPELFVLSGSLSGAFNATQNLDALRPEFRTKLLEVFSSEGSSTRTDNDVFTLLNAQHETPYPYFYVACGTSDFFLDTNRAFVQQLSPRNLPYEYHETAGGHTWEYWDHAVKPLLQAVDRALENGRASKIEETKKKPH